MQEKAVLLILLFMVPAFAGCAMFDQPERWELQLPLGLLLSPRAGSTIEDVAPAAELAIRELTASELGIRYTLITDHAADTPSKALDRLVQKKVAAIIAAVAPEEAAALAQEAATKKVPLLLVTPGEPAARVTTHLIQLAPTPASQGAALAALVTSDDVAVFQFDDVFTRAMARGFEGAYTGALRQTINVTPGAQGAAIAAARTACRDGAGAAVLLLPSLEAAWIVRGLQEGGCRAQMQILASASARQPDFVTEAGRSGDNTPYAAGAIGVEPTGARLAEFRAFFQTEYGRNPGAFAAETYDAIILATLASFEVKSSPTSKPVRATMTAAEVQSQLLAVAESPGSKHRDVGIAVEAAKAGDELDWIGYAHDYDFDASRVPESSSYDRWRVTPTGGLEDAPS